MTRVCFRCGGEIQEPVEEYAAYVVGDDTVSTEMKEVTEAVVHTRATKDAISALQTNHYLNTAIETLENAVVSGTDLINYLGTPPQDTANDAATRESNAKSAAPNLSDFDRVEVSDVSEAPSDTVKVEQVVREKTVQKTGLVHTDCQKDSDSVIWS